ncbi:E3 ubiquitin-protein ligase TRIM21-like [Genypterus blacodes]|uniref:E3 ubiquitin-protein ligase TRIM21-like n=1 Tax=Genypterus blacodes TaxID=154954 RepID=UPI003F758B50
MEAADRERTDGDQVFTALKQVLEKIQTDLVGTVKEKQRSTEKQSEDLIKELQRELSEQREIAAEAEKLLLSNDHLHLLQSFSSIGSAPSTKDWTQITVHQSSHEGFVVKAAALLEKLLKQVAMRKIQQSAVDVTVDPDTAHPYLILSDDEKLIYCGDVRKNLPDNPQRFDRGVNVLGKQSFFSGRFYFEVQVKGNTEWTLGVTTETSKRKGTITLSPQEGYWTVGLRNEDEYIAGEVPPLPLNLASKRDKVGVFVDYKEGLVYFYEVDAASEIFCFTGCSFTHKLLPYFRPGSHHSDTNSTPLIISAVSHSLNVQEFMRNNSVV